MLMWFIIMILVLAVFGFCILFLISEFSRFEIIKKFTGEKKIKRFFCGALIEVLILAVLGIILGALNAIVCIIFLAVFWIASELFFYVFSKILKKKIKYIIIGVTSITVTVIYLAIAWYQCNNVWVTRYNVKSDKKVEKLRIIHFADAHIGTVFDGKELEKYVDDMNKQNADVVVITGDFFDDETSKEDMIDACAALSKLKAEGGVYYVFGNHDKGYYGKDYRGYDYNDFVAELEKNNVMVLEDEGVPVKDDYYIIGRKDRGEEQNGNGRASMEELVSGIDEEKYTIVLDHQPHDYDAQKEAEVDLVLSGHTHGGQLWSIKNMGFFIGENDNIYGLQKRGNTNFIVTSGIADWELVFKTGCRSEYNVINIE